MKKICLSVIVLFAAVYSKAQVPQAFSYQAVIRNSTNALVANQTVSERISLIKDSPTGTVVYSEAQSVKTNANGLVSLQIGTGSILSGSFSSINWATGTYFIKIETDPTGSSSYTISNTTQLLSVPYALYASNSASLQYPDGLANITPVIIDSSMTSYTVPSGKNFYFQNASDDIAIGLDTILTNGLSPINTLIAGPNQIIYTSQGNKFYSTIIGFLVDAGVQAITVNTSNSSYKVPTGKNLFVYFISETYANSKSGIYSPWLNVNGKPVNFGIHQNSTWLYPQPIIFPSGTVLSGEAVINGYLK